METPATASATPATEVETEATADSPAILTESQTMTLDSDPSVPATVTTDALAVEPVRLQYLTRRQLGYARRLTNTA
jgi:hypothetical protein